MSELTHPTKESWLADRMTGIGASEVAMALGYCPPSYGSPFKLAALKLGKLPQEDLAKVNEAIEWGLRLEGAVIAGFAARTSRQVFPAKPFTIARDPSLPFLFATLDARQTDAPNRGAAEGDLQVKTASQWVKEDWEGDAIPRHYQIQVQAELAVTGLEWGSIAVLIGGNRLEWRDIERNDRFIDAMLPAVEEFWAKLKRGELPEPDGSRTTRRALTKMFPDENGFEITLPAEAQAWSDEILEMSVQAKELERQIEARKNKIKLAIGEYSFGVLPDGTRYSHHTSNVKSFTVAARQQRTLRKEK